MKKVNFMIASEQHCRIFARLAKGLGDFSFYRCGSPRAKSIDGVIKQNGIDKYERRKFSTIFNDILRLDEVFVIPLMLGTKSHSLFKDVNKFDQYMNTDLKDVKGTVAIMNEKLYHSDKIKMPYRHEQIEPGTYSPHGHILLARTQVEADLLNLQKEPGSKVVFIGDAGLNTPAELYKKGTRLLFMTSFDPTRHAAGGEVVREMLAHIEIYIKSGKKITELLLKAHPGEMSTDYRAGIKNLCKSFNIRFKEIDKWELLESIASKVDFAVVQSSLSSHFILRQMGVESFYYSSPKEKNEDNAFVQIAGMPHSKLNHKVIGKYSAKEYDKWTCDTFLINGKHVERFSNGIE